MALTITLPIEPQSSMHCGGTCPRIIGSEDHDLCGAFGERLRFVGSENGSYPRLAACIKHDVETK